MSSELQTVIALAIVGIAAGSLVWRALSRRRHPGGGCGGCPTDPFKAKLKR